VIDRVEHVMGMPIVVHLRDDDADESILDDVFGWFRCIDAVFSTYKDDSEISRINRGELRVSDAPPEVTTVLDLCKRLRVLTDGYFDVRAATPDVLDPSGLVKGWAVDRAGAILTAHGAREFSVNAGGDILLRGSWSVGIQHPLEPLAVAKIIEVTDGAVATSGDYRRAGTCSTRTRAARPRASSRSRSSGRTSPSPTPSPLRRSPWARRARSAGLPGCAATRR
jgi:FAD:protein FMN transferase